MLRYDPDGKLLPVHALQLGDDVVFSMGPFAGFIATVEDTEPDKRVWILLEIMGRKTRVAMDSQRLRVV
jgi:transcriptional antiterminator RfaH